MKNWELKKLGEVVHIINGKNQNAVLSVNGQYPILGSAGTVMGYATEFICERGTTIIGRKGNISNPIYVNERFWNVDTAFGIFPKNNYLPRFIHYLCLTIDFKSRNRGTTIPSLVKSDLLNVDILFNKSLPEQKRIVAILDEAFAAIAKAKANAERNLKNARQVFESYLQGVFENRGEDWEERSLGEIGKVSMCKRILKEQTLPTGEIPFYKIGTFGKKPDAFISKEIYYEFRNKFSYPKKGEILISASGTIGRCVQYDGEPAYFQDSNIVWLAHDEKKVLNEYLLKFYAGCQWNAAKGATILRLYNDNLRQINIAFPKSLKTQKTIVQKLNNLNTETQKLETIYQQKINDLDELKKSILQKAFSGELKTDKELA